MATYLGLVRALAWKIHQQLPRSVELDDLVGYGCVGLAEAAQSFDPKRGLKFTTFAYHRIRGSILDGLGQMAWFSRQKFEAREYQSSPEEEGRLASGGNDAALDAAAGEGPNNEWYREAALRLQQGNPAVAEEVADRSPTGDSIVAQRELDERLRQMIQTLPKIAAELLIATYYEGLSLKDAAHRMGRDKSWASRLHARALSQLARALRAEGLA